MENPVFIQLKWFFSGFDPLQSLLFMGLFCDGGTTPASNLSVGAENTILTLWSQVQSKFLSDFSLGFAIVSFKVLLSPGSGGDAVLWMQIFC